MADNNDYGVYKEQTAPLQWVVSSAPLQLGVADEAALYSEIYAGVISSDLTSSNDTGATYKVGRPGDTQP